MSYRSRDRFAPALMLVALCLLAMSHAAAQAHAGGMGQDNVATMREPAPSPSGLGQLLVSEPQSGGQYRLPLVRYHVNVVLHPPVALVQIDQSFYNPFDRQHEGTFVFNLPRAASVSRFAMFVSRTELVEGELVERERASDIYESIVRSMRDPAILEQLGENLFRMRVFPIFARDSKRILLDYTVPIVPDAGRCVVHVPMLSDRDAIGDFRLSGVIRGPTPIDSVSATIEPVAPVSVERRADGSIAFSMQQRQYRPRSHLVIKFAQPAAREPELRTYTVRSAGGVRTGPTYFLATLQPGAVPGTDAVPAAALAPADVLIMAETGYAVRDRAPLRQAVRSIVAALRTEDRFTLVCGDVATRRLADAWLEPGTPKADRAIEQFDGELFLGGTDVARCVNESIRQFDQRDPTRRRLFIYAGAGVASLGATDKRDLVDQVSRDVRSAGAKFVAVRVDGVPAARNLVDTVARETGGRVFDLHGGATDGTGRDALAQWLGAGLPSPVRIVALRVIGAQADDVFCDPSWLPGRPFDVSGRLEHAEPVAIELTTGQDGGARHRWTFTLPPDGDDVLVGRIWSQRRIRHALGSKTIATNGQRAELIRLSQEWGILTPYTAWLVLERESEYSRYGIARENRQRYWRDPDALPVRPLADSRVDVPPRPVQEIDRRAFDQALGAARLALERGDAVRAQALLHNLRSSPFATDSNEFQSLERSTQPLARVQTLLQSLGSQRRLVDPVPAPETEGIEPSVLPILVAGMTSRFAQFHPHAAKLLREAEPPADRMTLRDFGDWLERETGVNVVLGTPELAEEGIRDDDPLDTRGLHGMSLRSLARHVFSRRDPDIRMIEQPNRLLISTRFHIAADRLEHRIYPVVDIIQTERTPEPESLVHPYIDADRLVEARIREKLSRPISIDVSKRPLRAVAEYIAELLGEPVVLDRPALGDEGVNPDRREVSARWKNVPAGDSLRWILEPLDLDYIIKDEAIVITSAMNVSNELTTRLHSLHGVVFCRPIEPPDWPEPRSRWPWAQGGGRGGLGGGFAGGFGGMGGAGGGGGGGGFGGFAGGGMGAAVNIDTSQVAPAPTQPPRSPDSTSVPSDRPAERTGTSPSPPIEWPGIELDADSVIEAIEQTVLPDSWDSVGGAGSVQFWAPSLDLVVTQTDRGQDEIDRLLDELRRIPPAAGKRTGIVPAEPPRIGPDTPHLWDTDGLVEIIQSTVHPSSWDAVGGRCSVEVDFPRLALLVSADAETHESLQGLLLDLRRSRYFAAQGTRPWDELKRDRLSVLLAGARVTQLAGNLPPVLNSASTPDELALLSVRRELPEGQWRWRWWPTAGNGPREFTLRRGGPRIELDTGPARVRIDRDQAAVGYPGLTLVEPGPWGEAARRLLDARLPWLPHRSNEELARRFNITPVEADVDAVRLRFELPPTIVKRRTEAARRSDGEQLDAPDGAAAGVTAHIEATFSRTSGLPTAWEAFVDGALRLRLRLRFEAARDPTREPAQHVHLEDAAGRVREKWELVCGEAATDQLPQSAVPPLADGWPGFVQLGHQTPNDSHAAELNAALAAIRTQDWSGARRRLDGIVRESPDQPLVRLLHAWCVARDLDTGSHDAAVESLRAVARSGATDLIDAIGSSEFLPLPAAARFDSLVEQPEPTRTALQWERLALLAAETGRLLEAVTFVEQSIAGSRSPSELAARERLRISLLLRLGRRDEASAAARAIAGNPATDAESAAAVADLLFDFDEREAAEWLYARAAESRSLPPQRRYDVARSRARLYTRLERWRILIHAIDALPANSPQWSQAVDPLLEEIEGAADANAAGTLASEVSGRQLRTRLRLLQARLTDDPQLAADICWDLDQTGDLHDHVLEWAAGAMLSAKQHGRAICMLEERLRTQSEIPHPCLQKLRAAYASAGRTSDAERAATSPRLPRSR